MGRAHEVRKASQLKTGLAKSKLYSKYGKEIYMCAKNSGADPTANLSLKRLIEKAKSKQVPNSVIEKNIEKAKGGIGEDFQAIRYEGFGPGGCTIIVDCLTDNINRTISEVRNCFTKTGTKMGVKGCCEHLYQHIAMISFKGLDEETVLDVLMEADCDVSDLEEVDGIINIEAPANELFKIQDCIKSFDESIEFIEAESNWIPMDTMELEEDDNNRFEKFLGMIDECDDVQEVFHNVISK